MRRGTSAGEPPGEIMDGTDTESRPLTAGALLEEPLGARLGGSPRATAPEPPPPMPPLDKRTLLASFDYSRALDRDTYRKKLDKFQGRLNGIMRGDRMRERSIIVVFEGMDAAGKGSTIRW